jgi:hypothetical protein
MLIEMMEFFKLIGNKIIPKSPRWQLDANALPISNLAEPIEDTDASTKSYVDGAIGALPKPLTLRERLH